MTIYKRPDNTIFAESAQSGEVVAFENMPRGWGVTLDSTKGIPPMEWFNFLQNRTDKAINYILQNGVTEYDTSLEYPQNAVVKSNGKLYLCLRQNANKPLSNGTYWELLIKNATTSQSGIVQLSNATDSTSQTTASTSLAVKKANDNANNRLLKSGDTMTGSLKINQAGSYSGIALLNEKKEEFLFYSEPADSTYMCTARLNDNTIRFPKKNGILVLSSDKSSDIDSDSTATIATSLAVKTVNDKVNANSTLISKAQDKAVQANDNANNRLLKSGGELTGTVTVKNLARFEWDSNGSREGFFQKGTGELTFFARGKRYADMKFPTGVGTLALRDEGVLVGSIQAFASDKAKKGYLKCDGGLYSTTTYADLFAEIGYTWGGGDDKFAVPNLTDKARFLRSSGNGLKVGTYQNDAIRNIEGMGAHIDDKELSLKSDFSGSFEFVSTGADSETTSWKKGNFSGGQLKFDASRVVPTADENRPHSAVASYWIKY